MIDFLIYFIGAPFLFIILLLPKALAMQKPESRHWKDWWVSRGDLLISIIAGLIPIFNLVISMFVIIFYGLLILDNLKVNKSLDKPLFKRKD